MQAAIHVLASHLGAIVYRWNTPTPVIRQEHLYNSGTGRFSNYVLMRNS